MLTSLEKTLLAWDGLDDWERSQGVYLEASAQRDLLAKRRALPREPRQVRARVPLVGYRGAYRLGVSGDPTKGSPTPFRLSCQVFKNGILGVELQPTEESVKPLGRPVLGFCAKGVLNGYFGDPFSRDTNVAGIQAYVDPNGAALMSVDTQEGTRQLLDGLTPGEVFAFISICLGVYTKKYNDQAVTPTL